MKKIIKVLLLATLFFAFQEIVFAADVNLTIKDGDTPVFSGTVTLQPAGMISLKDANGNPYPNLMDSNGDPYLVEADSVLSVLNDADILSNDFTISDLQYSDSLQSFYLRCITGTATGEKCDNWQYWVGHTAPRVGVDKTTLTGGENIYLYYNFGAQHKVLLSSSTITTSDSLTITAEDYDYENSTWIAGTGVTIGLTQPDPNDPWTPIEVQTGAVDANGQVIFSSIPAGSYNVGIQDDFYFPTETLTVTTPSEPEHHHSSGGKSSSTPSPMIVQTKPVFDLNKAFDFLIAQQQENGSFGGDMYTGWVALALASRNNQTPVLKLIKYFGEALGHSPTGEAKMENPRLTDYERRAMALMALGLNPYNIYPEEGAANGENYIGKITASWDGKQFGDTGEDNDDVFALIVLQNAGYTQDEKMISDDMSFILSWQKEDGSWDESVDMTGATIEALSAFSPTPGVGESLKKAENFLKQNQKDNGGWNDNASSTAWALQGILALNEKPEDWVRNGNTPLDYLVSIQDVDGGIKNENMQNKIWQTAYAVSALSGKTWNQTMQKFEKPKITAVAETQKIKTIKTSPTVKNTAPKNSSAELKPENPTTQNTAAAISAVQKTETAQAGQPAKKNWFMRLLDSIFGF